jgi:hypothetical protein
MSQHTPSDQDSPMGTIYLSVILLQVAVTIALWWFGRTFSR